MKNKKTIALAMAAATVAPMAVPAFAATAITEPVVKDVDMNLVNERALLYVELDNFKEAIRNLENEGKNPKVVGDKKDSNNRTIGYVVSYDTKLYNLTEVSEARKAKDKIEAYLNTIKDEKIENTDKLRYTITTKTIEYAVADNTEIIPSAIIVSVQDNLQQGGIVPMPVHYTFENIDTNYEINTDVVIKRGSVEFKANPSNEFGIDYDNGQSYKALSKAVYEIKKAVDNKNVYVTTYKTDDAMLIRIFKADKKTQVGEFEIGGYSNFNSRKLPVIPYKNDFLGHWAENAIVNSMLDGVVSMSSKFRPDENITRAEFAKIVCEAFNLNTNKYFDTDFKTKFKDVDKGDWYARYIWALEDIGLVNGYSDGTFKPNETITRQEAAVIVAGRLNGDRLVDKTTTSVDGKVIHEDVVTKYADDKKIPVWADEAVRYLTEDEAGLGVKVLNGYSDNTFRPANKITRAEAVKMMHVARTAPMAQN